mmetsp:Transcript_34928/g.55875  ORF Transcript_34928/g.55875 Transcript_34928/m.55875 type:complete len:223 (-) Transcript_34928:247-915(-)
MQIYQAELGADQTTANTSMLRKVIRKTPTMEATDTLVQMSSQNLQWKPLIPDISAKTRKSITHEFSGHGFLLDVVKTSYDIHNKEYLWGQLALVTGVKKSWGTNVLDLVRVTVLLSSDNVRTRILGMDRGCLVYVSRLGFVGDPQKHQQKTPSLGFLSREPRFVARWATDWMLPMSRIWSYKRQQTNSAISENMRMLHSFIFDYMSCTLKGNIPEAAVSQER